MMDVYENMDILGNALPSASVIIGGGRPEWGDGGGVHNKTIKIPSNKPYTHTFNIKASSYITYYGTDLQVNHMYGTMFDIGLKFQISIEKYGDGRIYLIDAVKFGNCYISCYFEKMNHDTLSWTYYSAISVKKPKSVYNSREEFYNECKILVYVGIEKKYVANNFELSLISMTTSRNATCCLTPFYQTDGGGYRQPTFENYAFDDAEIVSVFGDYADKKVYSTEYGDYSGSGGYGGGSFDDSSDSFGLPSLPSLGVSEVGFINVYNPTKGQLQGFADELFPNFEMPTPSTKEGLEAIAENIANTFTVLGDFAESYVNAGLVNYVIDCHIVPVAPNTSGSASIKVGFKTFNYSPAKVTSDYVAFDCGSLEIAEYYQNFLDYEGTKAKLYLPFIGFVDIKPEWFQSGKLGVTYHFNIIDGSCIAFVIATSSKSKLKNTVVATFGGNCCVHMPITGVNYSSMISGVVGGAVGIASNASNMIKTNRADKGTVMSNIEGATGIASNLADAVGSKPSIEQSNGYNAGMSFMCYRRPYLLIERPVASFSQNYPKEQGLPLNVSKKLGDMNGFTTCVAPVVDNFHCLEEEKEMIKQALIEGTIF